MYLLTCQRYDFLIKVKSRYSQKGIHAIKALELNRGVGICCWGIGGCYIVQIPLLLKHLANTNIFNTIFFINSRDESMSGFLDMSFL